ncbi:hypothetical protein [Clostridium manihotivorum]|uniref:Uncharacterized protein n=1 Tax=Clostridium manihotivorum TaxID=2320868 RepID=A0A3R5UB74_9CLOT|nr:hypothetical protein [Clostridium manihotivorum]QAA34446.1 hypothetical protein C1I91_23950 [Clostridium manihotivorum]
MSLRATDRKKAIRKQDKIELSAILKFIRFIQAVSCGMLGISLIGFFLTRDNEAAKVVYCMVIVVNLIIILGGMIPIRYLTKKNI